MTINLIIANVILISPCKKEKKEKFACCILSRDMRKPVFGTELQGFQTGPTHKSGCAAIEDGLSFLDYDRRGTILSM